MKKITVLGLGKVGALAARLLHDSGFEVTGCDLSVADGRFPFTTHTADMADVEGLKALFADADAVLSCLPYQLNVGDRKSVV
jgi:saccharopine dehydrogenase-like NADP-dependent oxidoreductase